MAESKKSNFSVTCSLLSQYLKKNRSFGDLAVLDMAPKTQEPTKGPYRPHTTLNLLAGLEVSAETETEIDDAVSVSDRNFMETKEPENAPLTIFYGEKVMVFDNFSPEKAADLMNWAATTPAPAALAGAHTVVNPVNLNITDVPLQERRASLQRFLEKRKDRINSKAPYQINASSKVGPKPQLEARSWLGLGQEISNLS